MQPSDRQKRRGRLPSRQEAQLWQQAMADVRPLRSSSHRDVLDVEGKGTGNHGLENWSEADAVGVNRVASTRLMERAGEHGGLGSPHTTSTPAELTPGMAGNLDRRTLLRLRRGLIPPETQIDLHSHTQEQAHTLLRTFLSASQSAGRRCVLVITGKGFGPAGAVGILKSRVPQWLNEQPNRGRILAFCYARPSHGGEGALYVLLKRVRDASRS